MAKKGSSQLMLYLGAAALAAIVAFFAMKSLGMQLPGMLTMGGGAAEGFEGAKRLVVFHAQWCGHCKELLKDGGVWQEVKEKLPGVPIQEIDEASNQELIEKHDVTSFPDIRVLDGESSVATFEGDRTADAIAEFALKHIDAST